MLSLDFTLHFSFRNLKYHFASLPCILLFAIPFIMIFALSVFLSHSKSVSVSSLGYSWLRVSLCLYKQNTTIINKAVIRIILVCLKESFIVITVFVMLRYRLPYTKVMQTEWRTK